MADWYVHLLARPTTGVSGCSITAAAVTSVAADDDAAAVRPGHNCDVSDTVRAGACYVQTSSHTL